MLLLLHAITYTYDRIPLTHKFDSDTVLFNSPFGNVLMLFEYRYRNCIAVSWSNTPAATVVM